MDKLTEIIKPIKWCIVDRGEYHYPFPVAYVHDEGWARAIIAGLNARNGFNRFIYEDISKYEGKLPAQLMSQLALGLLGK